MMRRAAVQWGVTLATVIVLATVRVMAGGVGFGLPLYTMDVTGTLSKVPVAFDEVFDLLEEAFIDYGASTDDLDALRAQLDAATAEWETWFTGWPMWIPIPLLGGSIDIDLPLLVVDGVRISGGFMSDGVLRSIGRLSGLTIPESLVDLNLAAGDEQASLTADLEFSTFVASSELTKRFDLLLAAVELGAGFYLIGGSIDPTVSVSGTPDLSQTADEVVEALHLDGLTWSEFGAHVLVGVELGPPFLRVHADVRYTFPVRQTAGWWDIGIGRLAAVVGMVIRY